MLAPTNPQRHTRTFPHILPGLRITHLCINLYFPFRPQRPDTWQPIQNPTLKGTVRGENQQNDKSKKMGMQGAGEDMGYRQHRRPLTVRGTGGWSHGPQSVMEAQTPGRAQHSPASDRGPHSLALWPTPAMAGSLCREAQACGFPLPSSTSLAFPLPRRHTEQAHYPARAAAALAFTERGWRRRNHGNFAAEEKYKGKKGDVSLKILVLEIHNICIYPIIQVLCLFFFFKHCLTLNTASLFRRGVSSLPGSALHRAWFPGGWNVGNGHHMV